MNPDKVVITITGKSYNIEVFDGKKILSNRETAMESAGIGRDVKKGDIYDDLYEDFENLSEAIEDVNLDVFSIAGELFILNEE